MKSVTGITYREFCDCLLLIYLSDGTMRQDGLVKKLPPLSYIYEEKNVNLASTNNYASPIPNLEIEMKNVLIADDHAIVRLGMKQIICSLPGTMSVAEAQTFDDAISLIEANTFDLLILDINMPGGNNLQMIYAVKLRQPGIRILVFSAYDEILYALNYLKAGADGYIEKNSPDEEFRTAISAVLMGEKYISKVVRDQLIGKFTGQQEHHSNPFAVLSPREIEVMNLLTKGYALIKIAEILHLQLTTVSTYKTRIFEKVGVKNMIALVEKAQMYQVTSHH